MKKKTGGNRCVASVSCRSEDDRGEWWYGARQNRGHEFKQELGQQAFQVAVPLVGCTQPSGIGKTTGIMKQVKNGMCLFAEVHMAEEDRKACDAATTAEIQEELGPVFDWELVAQKKLFSVVVLAFFGAVSAVGQVSIFYGSYFVASFIPQRERVIMSVVQCVCLIFA